jgi:endonuclease/exonuclease/phosphatase family metal-dependent hydrolase
VADAGAAGEPLIVAGDFNVKPQDETYQMMVTGKIDPTHP